MSTQEQIFCNPCKYNGDNFKATVYCSACNEHLCFTCEKSHRGLKVTRVHDLVTITDIPPIVKREPVSTTCEGDTAGRISTTLVLKTNYSLTRSDTHNTGLCKKCSDKGENNSSALCWDCHKSINERNLNWYGISDDKNELSSFDQEPMLQQCKAHNVEVIRYYCENHKKLICELCQDASHRKCEKTMLPSISRSQKSLGETAIDTESENITIKTECKQTSNERSLVMCTKGNASNEHNLLDMNILKNKQIEIDPQPDKLKFVSCATFLSNGDLIVNDVSNQSLVLYDSNFLLKSSLLVNSISLFMNDMCRTSESEIAITVPFLQTIQLITTVPIITRANSFKVDKYCYGIDCHLDMLFVICKDIANGKSSILVTTKVGHIQRRLELNDDGKFLFSCPRRIRVSCTSGRMFVADNINNTVTCLTQSGDVVYEYKNEELYEPTDIFVDSEDNIIVCGYLSNNVHRVDKNGYHHSILISKSDGVILPRSLSYRFTDGALAVTMNENPSVIVYWLQK